MKFINQIQITEGYQGCFLTSFQIISGHNKNDDQIIDEFIKSNNFTKDCQPDLVKNAKKNSNSFLCQLFDNEKLFVNDFKELNKTKLFEFFEKFLNEDDWGDDKADFATLLGKFKSEIENTNSNAFFVISKDWFNEESEKLRYPESTIYLYYFLVIWIDRIENKLTVCESIYD